MSRARKFIIEQLRDDLAVLTELQDDYCTRTVTIPRDWLPPGACCGTYLHVIKKDQAVRFHPVRTDDSPTTAN